MVWCWCQKTLILEYFRDSSGRESERERETERDRRKQSERDRQREHKEHRAQLRISP